MSADNNGGALKNNALFMLDDRPARFFLDKSFRDVPNGRKVLTHKIMRYGGKVVKEDTEADVLLYNPLKVASVRGIEAAYAAHSDAKMRNLWVKSSTELKHWIERDSFDLIAPKRHRMPGRPPGRARVDFTQQDRENVARYLAMRRLHIEDGGLQGKQLYQELMEAGDELPDEYGWVYRHTWQSWREHVKKNMAAIVAMMAHQPRNHARHDYFRKRGATKEEEIDVDEEEEEEEEEEIKVEEVEEEAVREEDEEEEDFEQTLVQPQHTPKRTPIKTYTSRQPNIEPVDVDSEPEPMPTPTRPKPRRISAHISPISAPAKRTRSRSRSAEVLSTRKRRKLVNHLPQLVEQDDINQVQEPQAATEDDVEDEMDDVHQHLMSKDDMLSTGSSDVHSSFDEASETETEKQHASEADEETQELGLQMDVMDEDDLQTHESLFTQTRESQSQNVDNLMNQLHALRAGSVKSASTSARRVPVPRHAAPSTPRRSHSASDTDGPFPIRNTAAARNVRERKDIERHTAYLPPSGSRAAQWKRKTQR